MTKRWHFTAVTSNGRIVLAVSMVITVLGCFSIPMLTSDPDPLSYFPRDSDIVRDTHTLERRVTGMLPSQVVITGDVDAGTAVAMLEADAHVVKALPALDTSHHKLVFWCLSNQSDLPHLSDAATQWRTTIVQQGGELEWRGVAAQLVAADHAVRNVAASSLLGMVIIAGLLVGIVARSVRMGLASMWVNLTPVLFLILLIAATRTAISLPTFMIGAIAIGIGLDDTIHMLARWQRFREGRVRTVFRLRRACAGSSIVAAVTLLPLTASPFGPTAEFGLTLAIAILVALLADLVLLPVFMTKPVACGVKTQPTSRSLRGRHVS
jgi:predicted RND superfamily exporter protein